MARKGIGERWRCSGRRWGSDDADRAAFSKASFTPATSRPRVTSMAASSALEKIAEEPGRHVFLSLGHQAVLVFNPDITRLGSRDPKMPIPGAWSGRRRAHLLCRRRRGARRLGAPARCLRRRDRGGFLLAVGRALRFRARSRRQQRGIRRATDLGPRRGAQASGGSRVVVASHNMARYARSATC